MIYRRFPRSVHDFQRAIRQFVQKLKVTPKEEWIVEEQLATRMQEMDVKLSKEVTEKLTAFQQQSELTQMEDLAQSKLHTSVRHFIMVFNMAVTRGVYLPSERKYYNLDMESGELPGLTRKADLLLWAEYIIKGEAQRMKKEGAIAMSNPTAAEVQENLENYRKYYEEHRAAKDAFNKENQDVVELMPELKELVGDVWDTVEFHYRKLQASSRRKMCRAWGVVYESRNGQEQEGEVEKTEDQLADS